MKLLILTIDPNNYNPRRIKQEAEKKQVESFVFNYKDLVFNFFHDTEISIIGKNILDFDLFILRGAKTRKDLNFWAQKNFLAKFLLKNKKRVLNGLSFSNFPERFDKFFQHTILASSKLPVIPTVNLFNYELNNNLQYPLLLKPIAGSFGDKIVLIKTKEELINFSSSNNLSDFLLQKFLTTGEDFRILVVNGEPLGALKRKLAKGKIVTNISAGGSGEKGELTEELKNLAIKAALAFTCDYAGVDIMYDSKRNPYILEVNRNAEFEGFEKWVGVNAAGAIIEYLLQPS